MMEHERHPRSAAEGAEPITNFEELEKAVEDIDFIRDLPDSDDIIEQLVELQKLVLKKIGELKAFLSRQKTLEKTMSSHNYNARLKAAIRANVYDEILGDGKSG